MNPSFTNVPSGLKTWIRSFARSQTYSKPSLESSAQCTGIAELLRGRSIRIVVAKVGVVGFVAVGAPVPLVLAGIGVEDDHAMVAVAVGDIHFVGLPCRRTSWPGPEVLDIVAALALAGLADLHQEFSVLGELQDHVVVE